LDFDLEKFKILKRKMASISVTINGDERQEANEWIRFGMKLAVQSALHPIEYAKTLIQVSNLRTEKNINHFGNV
jgi:hypothetical protein